MQDQTHPFKQAFEVLQDKETYLENIAHQTYSNRVIWAQVALVAILCFGYGLVMGSYNSLSQALLTGMKLWALLFLTLLICFPSLYIVQLILGSKLTIKQLIILLLSGLVVVSTVMVAFAPIVLFFQLSADSYQFLQLLHVFIFIFSGFYGMRIVLEALKRLFEANAVYPKIGITVFQIWVVIFAFVGMQLSWNMRPFIGSKNLPFELFRSETSGNFYTTVLGAVGDLLNGGDQKRRSNKNPKNNNKQENNTIEEDSSLTKAGAPSELVPDSMVIRKDSLE